MNLGSKLKYVGVEMMRKDAKRTDTPEIGLFRGISTRTANNEVLKLIVLGFKDKPNDVHALNAEMYNIMTLLFYYGECKEMIVFKNTDEDQKQADELLDAVLEQLKEEKCMLDNDPEIVDIEKFVEVPKEFFTAEKPATTTTTTHGTGTGGSTTYNQDWQKKQAEKKKEEERQEKMRWTPFIIGRKTERPAMKDLNLIKKKLAQLAAGEYERNLPELDEPEEKKDDKKNTGATNSN